MEKKIQPDSYENDAKGLLSEIVGTESNQKEDISKIIDRLRDKTDKYDLSFLSRREKDFLMELVVVNKLIFKKSKRIPELINIYLDLSKSVDGQFIKTISDLYKIENRNESFYGEMPRSGGMMSRFRR
jgi:hypothetical protein